MRCKDDGGGEQYWSGLSGEDNAFVDLVLVVDEYWLFSTYFKATSTNPMLALCNRAGDDDSVLP